MENTPERVLSKDGKIWDIISKYFFTELYNFPHFQKLTYIISTVRKK